MVDLWIDHRRAKACAWWWLRMLEAAYNNLLVSWVWSSRWMIPQRRQSSCWCHCTWECECGSSKSSLSVGSVVVPLFSVRCWWVCSATSCLFPIHCRRVWMFLVVQLLSDSFCTGVVSIGCRGCESFDWLHSPAHWAFSIFDQQRSQFCYVWGSLSWHGRVKSTSSQFLLFCFRPNYTFCDVGRLWHVRFGHCALRRHYNAYSSLSLSN